MHNEPKIILNIGTGKFFLHQTAEHLIQTKNLNSIISGVIIIKSNHFLEFFFGRNKKWQRLLNRISLIDANTKVTQVFPGELLWQIGTICSRWVSFRRISAFFYYLSSISFDLKSQKHLKKISKGAVSVYHYRAGFGGKSVILAKTYGLRTICDHSYPHPLFDWLNPNTRQQLIPGRFSIENRILMDLNNADDVIVNSDFVASTFAKVGDLRKLTICTPPIDLKFIDAIVEIPSNQRLGVLFVGYCSFRKGIDRLAEIAANIAIDIPLLIVGDWDPKMLGFRDQLQKRVNTSFLPHLSFNELAKVMSTKLVFLFPTRAEGSARVIGEALHSGCIVITTSEAGVALQNGEGFILDEMNMQSVANLINQIHADRNKFSEISKSGTEAIKRLEMAYYPTLINLYAKSVTGN